MDAERIRDLTLETIKRMPKKYKFKLTKVIEADDYLIQLIVISPDNKECFIYAVDSPIEKLSDDALIGVIGHEFAHYWTGPPPAICENFLLATKLSAMECISSKKGNLKEVEKYRKNWKKLIKKGKIYGGMKAYFKHENKTDLFASEKFGLRKEIKAMKYFLEEKGINVRFEFHYDW